MALSLVLGFESTAHTFGVALAQGNAKKPFSASTNVLANVSKKYPSTAEGFIPRKLADFHAKNYPGLLRACFGQAGVSPSDVDAVAYSYGPGLGHSLHVGFIAAKSFAVSQRIPFLGVNHGLAHVEVGRFFCQLYEPLVLYVSGGNTQILSLENVARKGAYVNKAERQGLSGSKQYVTLGETLDIGVGNFLDLVGRHLKLDPPDAVGVLRQAPGGRLLSLPYVVKGMNVSFTGLLTAVKRLPSSTPKQDVCFTAQEVAFSMLCETLEKALVFTGKKGVLLVGGNARNARLQEMVSLVAQEHGATFGVPPFEYCGDNGGMIALTGLMQWGAKYGFDRMPNQKVRVEQEHVLW